VNPAASSKRPCKGEKEAELRVLADDGVELLGEFTRGLYEANGDWTNISEITEIRWEALWIC